MTWDYTDFSEFWRIIANIIYLALFVSCVCFGRNKKTIKLIALLSLIFFNPFAVPVQNHYMPVYYRNCDIAINYYSLFLGLSLLVERLFFKLRFQKVILTSYLIASLYVAYCQINYHPHTSFEKYEGYDEILRMTRDEADILKELKYIHLYEFSDKEEWPKVISSIYQTRTEVPQIHTLYSRNNTMHKDASESDKELYKIFYRTDYENDPYAPENPDFENMCEYLKESEIDIIIQDKRVNYYDKESDTWYSLTYVIDRCGEYPVYENDSFAIYNYSD